MEALVIIWMICAIVGSLIGRPKGYPVWGFFLGLLLGVFGVAIITLHPSKKVREV